MMISRRPGVWRSLCGGIVVSLICLPEGHFSHAQQSSRQSESDQEEVCLECSGERLGTAITWYRDSDAAKLAREQDKLVFVIQVSGNFACEEFT